MSERALNLLSRVEFNEGISKGLPSNTIFAHKFGERELANGVSQLHDCGIVYYPGHPYVICVMTRGSDFKTLSDTIAEISRITFSEISRKYR